MVYLGPFNCVILKNPAPAPSRKKAQLKPFFQFYIKLIYQYKRENIMKITMFTGITYVLQVLYEKKFLSNFP